MRVPVEDIHWLNCRHCLLTFDSTLEGHRLAEMQRICPAASRQGNKPNSKIAMFAAIRSIAQSLSRTSKACARKLDLQGRYLDYANKCDDSSNASRTNCSVAAHV